MRKTNILLLALFAILLWALAACGGGESEPSVISTPTEAPTPTAQPSPTPTQTPAQPSALDKESFLTLGEEPSAVDKESSALDKESLSTLCL